MSYQVYITYVRDHTLNQCTVLDPILLHELARVFLNLKSNINKNKSTRTNIMKL